MNFSDHYWNMELALEEAEKAYKAGEVPVGAVIVSKDGKVLAKEYNKKENNFNPCGHAEILAMIEAAKVIKNWRLIDCSLYVTLEPCPMCLMAIVHSRIRNLYFGAYDSKGGSISLNYNFHTDKRLNHSFSVIGGVLQYNCSKMLSQFFRERRKFYKK